MDSERILEEPGSGPHTPTLRLYSCWGGEEGARVALGMKNPNLCETKEGELEPQIAMFPKTARIFAAEMLAAADEAERGQAEAERKDKTEEPS